MRRGHECGSHGHAHADLPDDARSHTQQSQEYRNYFYLFAISIISAAGEFLVALLLAHSVSAQADAIHSLTHIALFGLACGVSGRIYTRRMSAHDAYHYRNKFLLGYAALVFLGLAWILYASVAKFFSPAQVAGIYMLASVSIGLAGNIITLKILNAISKIHGGIMQSHTAHRWLNLDTWGDFAFSVIVLITSLTAIVFPLLPISILDPLVSVAGVIWIGWSGIQIFRTQKI